MAALCYWCKKAGHLGIECPIRNPKKYPGGYHQAVLNDFYLNGDEIWERNHAPQKD